MSLVASIFGTPQEEAVPQDSIFDRKVDFPKPRELASQSPVEQTASTAAAIPEDAASPPSSAPAEAAAHEPLQQVPSQLNNKISKNSSSSSSSKTDPEVDARTVFVGNLPVNTSRKQLAALFSDCGKIVSTRIRSVPVAGVKLPAERAGDQNLMRKVSANIQQIDTEAKDSVAGYVVFETLESVALALEKNNMSVPDDNLESSSSANRQRHIRVDHATPTQDAYRTVFVGNLPYGTKEDTLRAHFCKECELHDSDIEGVRVVRDKDTFQCKGFAYVLFKEKSMVATALRRMHGSNYMNRELRVQVCGRRTKGRKGEKKAGDEKVETPVGALRRLLAKQTTKKKRPRGEKKKNKPTDVKKAGMSKRAASEAKTGKRIKKIEKRVSKGMGKARK